MIHLSIEEPKIEKFFNSSKEEIIKALNFIVENDIHDFSPANNSSTLSSEQKEELNSRINSFHQDPTTGRSWDEIKDDLKR
ncbi:MAG: addiction module protein [Campylobacterota bacterium]